MHDVYPLSREEFLSLLGRHWSKLMIAGGLLAFVQVLVVSASCVLRRALTPPPRPERATTSEQRGLIYPEDDEEEDEDAELPQVI